MERMKDEVRGAVTMFDQLAAGKRRSTEHAVTEIINSVGVPAHIRGYHYLRDAIIRIVDEPEKPKLNKLIYESVAEKFNTTASRVERSIRHAIEVAWIRGDTNAMRKYIAYTNKKKPTNSEFIAHISDFLHLQTKEYT
jgi:two-component system response regulator (stage 0 sporulation protein A)